MLGPSRLHRIPQNSIARRLFPAGSCTGGYRTPARLLSLGRSRPASDTHHSLGQSAASACFPKADANRTTAVAHLPGDRMVFTRMPLDEVRIGSHDAHRRLTPSRPCKSLNPWDGWKKKCGTVSGLAGTLHRADRIAGRGARTSTISTDFRHLELFDRKPDFPIGKLHPLLDNPDRTGPDAREGAGSASREPCEMKEPTKDFGWQARAAILQRDAEQKLVDPLRRHGWTAVVDRVEGAGEYAVVVAERNGLRRTAALLYSSGTANAVYRRLEGEVDLTLFNGQPYELKQFTQGLSRSRLPSRRVPTPLGRLNRERASGGVRRAALTTGSPSSPGRDPRVRRLLAEVPAEAVWSRLSRLKSARLACKALRDRAEAESRPPYRRDRDVQGGRRHFYAIRNAADYFSLRDAGNLDQRVLNVYYGVLSFVLAEMLASPVGPARLESVGGHRPQARTRPVEPGRGRRVCRVLCRPTGLRPLPSMGAVHGRRRASDVARRAAPARRPASGSDRGMGEHGAAVRPHPRGRRPVRGCVRRPAGLGDARALDGDEHAVGTVWPVRAARQPT